MLSNHQLAEWVLDRNIKRAGKIGIEIWRRDYARFHGTPKDARRICASAPFSEPLTYQLIDDAGLDFMRRAMTLSEAKQITRFEEVYWAKIAEPDEHLDPDELREIGLRLSLYACSVMQPVLSKLGRFHVAVQQTRALVERFSNERHSDVRGAQDSSQERELKYMLLGPAISGLVYWFPKERS